ncbi:MAG TPA: tyrosine-type recombinase/integrase [Methylomirabilota bacterium]|nr:tyrosine-type recombinase/integrase [Methylomirabilota bacterium]
MGSLYKQKGSRIWWAKYYANGRPVRESTGTHNDQEAGRFLKAREGRVAAGQPLLPRVDRVRYAEIAQDLRRHYEATGKRDLKEFDYRVKHLERFFDGRRVASIGQAEVDAYILARHRRGAAAGTIRRELGTLVKMLRLAYTAGKLVRLPVLEKPKEGAPREGFFEREQYEAVRQHLPADLQLATAIAYTYGWRTQSEVLILERRQLDLEAGTLRLDPGQTKNDDGRLVYLTPELKTLLGAQLERIRAVERRAGRILPYLFPYLSGAHRLGQRRRDYRKAWVTACEKAGVVGRVRHDFRRTAVRNMVNRGVAERVAMTITGHKTRSVFDRYHIVSPRELEDAARRLTGIVSGIVRAADGDSRRLTP